MDIDGDFLSARETVDGLSPYKGNQMMNVAELSSPDSCASYEDMEPSILDDGMLNGLISVFNGFGTASKKNKRRSSTVRRSLSGRRSVAKVTTKQLRKSLGKLSVPTQSTTFKQRSKLCSENVGFSSSIKSASDLGGSIKRTTGSILCTKSLTKPVSPNLRINNRGPKVSKSVVLTSEELQYNKLVKEKREEEQRIKKFRAQYQALKSGGLKPTTIITQSVKTLTVPKTPESHVNKRQAAKMAEKGLSGVVNGKKPVVKKAAAPKPYVMPSRPTQVAPFKFAASRKDTNATTEKVVLSAEIAQKFFQNSRSSYVPVNAATKLTVCEAPKLRTTARAQPVKIKSSEEKEEEEMRTIKSKPFKALPLDRRIFDSMGELGVPKVESKACTETVGFELRSDKRASIQRVGASTNAPVLSPKRVFKARPLPTTTKEPPVTPAVKHVFQPTIGVSPKLRGGSRASSAPTRRQKPHHSVVEQQKKEQENARLHSQSKLKCTEPKEFALQTSVRGSMYKEQLIEQLQRQMEDEAAAREVKAVPVPDLTKAFQPIITHKEPTEQQPFQLRSAARHDTAQSLFQQELEAEEERVKAELFKARPLPKTTHERQEVVEHVERAPLKPLPLSLSTDARAKKRQEFDFNIQAKMLEIERMQQDLNKQKHEQENSAIKELRKKSIAEGGLCFKASGILEKDPFPTQAVAFKPLTEPRSPALRTKHGTHGSVAKSIVKHVPHSSVASEKFAASMRDF